MDLFKDIITSINTKSKNVLDDHPDDIKDYVPYIVNNNYSYYKDTIFLAQEMNLHAELPLKMQYDFLYTFIPSGRRFAKWKKSKKYDVDFIKEAYNVNDRRALEILNILTEEQLNIVRQRIYKGERL